MMSYFPEPNFSGGGIYQNWFGSGSNQSYNDQFDIKVDHRFNEKNLVSVKYSYQYNHGTGSTASRTSPIRAKAARVDQCAPVCHQ